MVVMELEAVGGFISFATRFLIHFEMGREVPSCLFFMGVMSNKETTAIVRLAGLGAGCCANAGCSRTCD